MGIVIRTAFNNRGWAGPCKNPYGDPWCYLCTEGRINVNNRKPIRVDENGFCKGDIQAGEIWCWEQTLCTEKSFWGNPQGKWGHRAYPGAKVYLVYKERDGAYTLWGKTKVERIDNEASTPTLYFKPFKPLPDGMRVKGLSAIHLTGRKWGQGTFRYIGSEHEAILDSRIGGGPPRPNSQEGSKNSSSVADYMTVTLRLKVNITERLKRIAESEGREIEDMMREALAEWLKGRES